MNKYVRKTGIISIFAVFMLLCQSFAAFAQDNYYANMSSTPNNASVNTIWNSVSVGGVDAYWSGLHTPSGSSYLKSTTIDGKTENYYLMEINLTRESGNKVYTIYTDTSATSYKVLPYYHNGYNTTWYPAGSYNFNDGVFCAPRLFFEKYSWATGEYYYFKLFDVFYNRDYSFDYIDVNYKPYFCSNKLLSDTRIVYGQADWFSDRSGDNKLISITRKTGAKVQSNNIYFYNNSEFESGVLMNSNTYAFVSSVRDEVSGRYVSGYTLYLIDPDTLTIKKKIPLDRNYDLSLDSNGNLILKNGGSSLSVDGTNFNVTDQSVENATNAVVQLEDSLKDLSTQDLINKAQDNLTTAQALVDRVPAGTVKDALQARINAAKDKICKAQEVLNATNAVVQLEDSLKDLSSQDLINKAQGNLTTAQALVDKLPIGTDKDALQARINAAKDKIDKAQDALNTISAENAVGNLEDSVKDLSTQDKIDKAQSALTAAQTSVDKLPVGAEKDSLQSKIDAAKAKINEAQNELNAANAVKELEDSVTNLSTQPSIDKAQSNLTAAQASVDKLPAGTLKDSLQDKIDAAKAKIAKAQNLLNTINAANAVQDLEDSVKDLSTQPLLDKAKNNLNAAQALIDKLPNGTMKDLLKIRTFAAKVKIDVMQAIVSIGKDLSSIGNKTNNQH